MKLSAELEAKFEAEIEHLLRYMSASEFHLAQREGGPEWGNRFKGRHWKVPLSVFDGAYPFTPTFLEVADALQPEYGGYFRDVRPSDLDGKWDVCVLNSAYPEDAKDGWLFSVSRYMSMPLSQVRGKQILGSYLSRNLSAILRSDGTYESAYAHCFWNGKQWVHTAWELQDLHAPHAKDPEGDGDFALFHRRIAVDLEEQQRMSMMLGIQFNRDYDWTVTLRLSDGPGLSLVTDPIGARELFRLRDIPNGQGRRGALRNWIREHWRRSRCDDNEAHKVREHLRGATEFVWNGMSAKIAVAPYDLRRAERLKCEAESARVAGLSRRGSRRVRIAG